jgi:hypothetical protein
MMDEKGSARRHQFKNGSYVDPPNGRVSQRDLYKALYDLDQGLGERFTSMYDGMNDIADRLYQLRADFEGHRGDGHPFTQKAEIVKEEIKLDAQKAAIVTAFLGLIAALGAGATELFRFIITARWG